QSVTDMAAWRALKTPTAVAGFITERTLDCENRIIGMAETLATSVTRALDAANEQLSSFQNRVAANARLRVSVSSERLGFYQEKLHRSSVNTLTRSEAVTARTIDSLYRS